VSYARHVVEAYFRRTGRPGDQALDAAYQFEVSVLRDVLSRLEAILDDEGVPRETAERIIRCMVYGAPSPTDAELRMQQSERMIDLLSHAPPRPLFMPESRK
jgi:hypothetical protein